MYASLILSEIVVPFDLANFIRSLNCYNHHGDVRRLRKPLEEVQTGVSGGTECRQDFSNHQIYVRQF